jgi:capsular exopolysaccharide synthesis family protein
VSYPDQPARERESEGLAGTLSVVRRRWMVVVGVLVVCVGFALVKHERAAKSYQATASVSFQNGTLAGNALNVSPSNGAEPQREADTEATIAHSPEVAEAVRKQLHLSASAQELLEQVKVETAQNANVLNFIGKTHDPHESAQLSNAFAEQYIAFRARSELSGITTAQTKLEQQLAELPATSPERATLEQSLQRLDASRAVAGGGANVIGRATPPTSPSGLGAAATALIALLVGLALALAIVFLLETLDRRIKSIEGFEREYRLSALTGVPQSAFRHQQAAQRDELLEPYRILRSALDFAAVTRQLDTLLITSAVSGEGKTTVAVDLAHAVALTGRRTILIELDLRRPTLARHFEVEPGTGLTTALVAGTPVAEQLVEPFPDLPNFSVLPSGRLPQNPSELLGSPHIAEAISEFSTPDGIVIIDAPPLNPVADTQVLLNNPAVHAAIVVARVGTTTRDEVRRARAILDRHMIEPVGLVVTGLRDSSRYGYSSYSYSGEEATLNVELDSSDAERGASKLRL